MSFKPPTSAGYVQLFVSGEISELLKLVKDLFYVEGNGLGLNPITLVG